MLSGKARLMKARDDEARRMTDEWVEDTLGNKPPDPFDMRWIPIRHNATSLAQPLDDSGTFTIESSDWNSPEKTVLKQSRRDRFKRGPESHCLWDEPVESAIVTQGTENQPIERDVANDTSPNVAGDAPRTGETIKTVDESAFASNREVTTTPVQDRSVPQSTATNQLSTMFALRTVKAAPIDFSWRRFATVAITGCVVGAFLLMLIAIVVR